MDPELIDSKNQQHIRCYCSKKSTIQLGLKVYPYFDVIIFGALLYLAIDTLFMPLSVGSKLMFISLLVLIPALLYMPIYIGRKKVLTKEQHTASCVKKIALRSLSYIGPWSDFGIVELPKDTKAVKEKGDREQ